MQRGAASALNIESGSVKENFQASGSDDNNSADNLKFGEPATLQLVRKGKNT